MCCSAISAASFMVRGSAVRRAGCDMDAGRGWHASAGARAAPDRTWFASSYAACASATASCRGLGRAPFLQQTLGRSGAQHPPCGRSQGPAAGCLLPTDQPRSGWSRPAALARRPSIVLVAVLQPSSACAARCRVRVSSRAASSLISPVVDLFLQIGRDPHAEGFLRGHHVRRDAVQESPVVAAPQRRADTQEHVDIVRCQLVLLQMALQLRGAG